MHSSNHHLLNNELEFYRNKFKQQSQRVLSNPNAIRHIEPSLICSPDANYLPSDHLIEVALNAAQLAWKIRIEEIDLSRSDSQFFNIFPGEHYRLLKALTRVIEAKEMVEIGTSTGMGSTAILQGLDQGSLITFDVVPWNQFESHLHGEMFGEKLQQAVSDLSIDLNFEEYFPILDRADCIFIDGPKDSVFEYRFCYLLRRLAPRKNRFLIFDDIRFVNMIDLWRGIRSPKLDITSFGHWSGTGLVDVSGGFSFSLTPD